MLQPQITFQVFSIAHLAALGCIAAITVAFVWILRQPWCAKRMRGLALALAGVLAMNELVWVANVVAKYGFDVRDTLPLHMCDVSFWLAIFCLMWPRQLAFEWVYFFGIGAAIQALLTPELQATFPDWDFIKFFVSHGGIFVAVALLVFGFGLRPYARSIMRMSVAGTVYVVVVGAINWALGANYGYLARKPAQPSLLDHMGPWPWYVGVIWVMGFLTLLILYAPWFALDKWRARSK